MGRINILPPSVYNRIAAGEVIERPYSVVKELVENAIDAGATEIEINVEEGGKSFIRVLDNGCGILREDLPSVFLPHATSKLSKAEDLENLLTLGFRGEAIASIASVSELTIKSKTEGAKCYELRSNCGELGEICECAESFAHGTEVTVSRLFANAPVRLNFLKTDRGEEADISAFVARFIMSKPNVSFRYYVNGKSVFQSFGEGDEEAFVCVYGANVLENCYKINAEKHGIKISGFIGNQNYVKPTKSYQTVFLNGRYIVNQTIASAVSGAYANYLMKRQYPFYVLHITVPPEIVDVNVHPNKADVRFSDNKIIYGCVYRVISDVLDGNATALDYVMSPKDTKRSILATSKTSEKLLTADALLKDSEKQLENKDQTGKPSELSYAEARKAMSVWSENQKYSPKDTRKTVNTAVNSELPFDLSGTQELSKETDEYVPYIPRKKTSLAPTEDVDGIRIGNAENNGALYDMFSDLNVTSSSVSLHSVSHNAEQPVKKGNSSAREAYAAAVKEGWNSVTLPKAPQNVAENAENQMGIIGDVFAENKRYLLEKETAVRAKQQSIDVSSFTYAGKIFNTYLIYEHGDEVYLIDQHAAHERLIFDRLKMKMQKRQVSCQTMLVPFELSLNAQESVFLRENLENIRAIGFEISETKENQFSVCGVPTDLTSIDLGAFFNEIIAESASYRGIKLEELLRDKLASAACKAAVKGGYDLTKAEIDELFRLMDGNLGLRCPHGRPVVARVGKTELEKLFKRIV